MIPAILPTYSRAPLAFERGEGSWLWTEDGTRYLDLGAGIAVNALGHAHPALVETLSAQAAKLWHVSNLYEIPHQRRLAEMLVDATFAETCFFTNSGTEACELAVKMARKHFAAQGAGRHRIVTVEGAFHGRSMAAISAAGSEKMTAGFGPLLPGFTQIRWGDHDALEATMGDDVAAILVETIQGEGGIRPLPDPCLMGLRDLCDRHGALLILDEVQCGMGRTGRLFAHEWANVAPDIMMVAKGIGGGFPLGALLATGNAASGMTAGTHGSTYGGNPLACAVGAKVMEVITAPGFLDRVCAVSGRFRQGLEGLVADHPQIFGEVRGQGLMLGLKARVPNTEIVAQGYAQHLLTVPAGDNVVRILPALTIGDGEVGEALARLDAAACALERAA